MVQPVNYIILLHRSALTYEHDGKESASATCKQLIGTAITHTHTFVDKCRPNKSDCMQYQINCNKLPRGARWTPKCKLLISMTLLTDEGKK